jgi:hypothetical protein
MLSFSPFSLFVFMSPHCPISPFRLASAFNISSYPVQTSAAEITFRANRGDMPLKNPMNPASYLVRISPRREIYLVNFLTAVPQVAVFFWRKLYPCLDHVKGLGYHRR